MKKIHELTELKINKPMILKMGWLKVNEGPIFKESLSTALLS